MTSSIRQQPDRRRVLVLWTLLAAFVARVLGQLLVVVARPAWLPPMEQWYSGLLPYSLLLPTQILLIAIMAALALRVTRRHGRLGTNLRRRRRLTATSYLYATVMLVRYVVQLVVRPEWRWFGHTIPIAFHLVLASFLFVVAAAYTDA